MTLDLKKTLNRKSLVENLIKKSNDQVKTLTHPQFLLGFSKVQIAQVLDNCEYIFTVQDVLDKVEMGIETSLCYFCIHEQGIWRYCRH